MTAQTDLAFELREIQTRHGVKRALVVTPTRHLRVDRERMDRLTAGDESSAVDDAIVEHASRASEPVDVVLFRACHGNPDHSWGFDPDLLEEATDEVGYAMVRSQLSLYRRLMEAGIFALVGVEFGTREVEAFTRATDRLSDELQQVPEGPDAARARVDCWLLDHLALWTSHDLEIVVDERLPKILDMLERRAPELERLRADLAS